MYLLHIFEIFRHVGSILGDISNSKSVTTAYCITIDDRDIRYDNYYYIKYEVIQFNFYTIKYNIFF